MVTAAAEEGGIFIDDCETTSRFADKDDAAAADAAAADAAAADAAAEVGADVDPKVDVVDPSPKSDLSESGNENGFVADVDDNGNNGAREAVLLPLVEVAGCCCACCCCCCCLSLASARSRSRS